MFKMEFLFHIIFENSKDFLDNIVKDVKQHPHRKLIKTLELMIMLLVIDDKFLQCYSTQTFAKKMGNECKIYIDIKCIIRRLLII